MHRTRHRIEQALRAIVISTIVAFAPTPAHALEVGKLFIYSHLYERLDAEIQLIEATEEEIESLLPSVAPPAHFGATEVVNQPEINVSVVTRADGLYSLKLSSEQPVSEPILQFQLRTVWSQGHLVHDFSALVDPANPIQNGTTKRSQASTRADTARPEVTAEPEPPTVSTQQPDSAASHPNSAPTVLSPPRVLVEISPRGEDEESSTDQSTPTLSNEFDEGGDDAEVATLPVETEEVPTIAVQAIAKPQPPLVSTQPEKSKGALRVQPSRKAADTVQQTKRGQQALPATEPQKKAMLAAATAFIGERPQLALILLAALVAVSILVISGLIFIILRLRRHNTTREFQEKAPSAKVVVPTTAKADEDHTDGNGRRAENKRRHQGRRASSDRRKKSIPVAFDRRSGLSRRRSEILDGGIATVSSEALDPIAEADVYLSAGSYDHAEATLREALATDPARQDLKVKLLQIYHQKGDQRAFHTLAEELQEVLDGSSTELWQELEANGWPLDGSDDDAGDEQQEILLEAAEPERVNGNARLDMDMNAEKTDTEMDAYTIEFEPEPQDCSVVDTLKDAFDEFLQARKNLKARTIDNYKQVMDGCFADWHKKTILQISEDMVVERHRQLCQEHGKAYANRAMRCLRTMYNFFNTHYRDAAGKSAVSENPVKSLTQI